MAADHLLALDAGTSGARCVIVSSAGKTLAAERRDWSYKTPEVNPLARSFDADEFWSTLAAITKQALKHARLSDKDIAAVGVTAQRLAFLVVDGDGRVIYAGPNSDARAVREGLLIDAQHAERIYRSSGKLPSLICAPARIQWLRDNRADDFARAASVLTLGDWVASKLTGVSRGERTLAGDCGLLDVSTGERDSDLLDLLGIPSELLPPLVSPTDVIAEVTKSAAEETGLAEGMPVVIAGADTQCALFGMGVEEPGEVGIVAGWSCPLQIVTPAPRFDEQRRTWVCPHVVAGRWLVESSTHDAGRVWRWWAETLLGAGDGAMQQAAELAAQAAPGASHVIALLGPRAMNAGAMGLHLGGLIMHTPLFPSSIDRPELLRAVLENIVYALRANLEQAEEVAGERATRIALGGGLTRAGIFPQLLADALRRPIDVASEIDVSARGSCRLAARALGRSDEPYRAAMSRVEPDAAASEQYTQRYERWHRLGERLDDIMKEAP